MAIRKTPSVLGEMEDLGWQERTTEYFYDNSPSGGGRLVEKRYHGVDGALKRTTTYKWGQSVRGPMGQLLGPIGPHPKRMAVYLSQIAHRGAIALGPALAFPMHELKFAASGSCS